MRDIWIRTVHHQAQRYATLGDWFDNRRTNTLEISVTKTGDWRYDFLIGFHELVEAALCEVEGISSEEVDEWDINGPGRDSLDPGADPQAPYHAQHVVAEAMERWMAIMMGVDWSQYSAALAKLD